MAFYATSMIHAVGQVVLSVKHHLSALWLTSPCSLCFIPGETPAVSDLVNPEARVVMRSLAEDAYDRVAKQLVVSHKSLRALEKRMEKDR